MRGCQNRSQDHNFSHSSIKYPHSSIAFFIKRPLILLLPVNNNQFMKTAFLLVFLNLILSVPQMMAQSGKTWTLQECIEYALNQNIQVRKSDLTNQSFQYYAAQAKAQRFPSVNADITQSFSWSKDPTGATSGYSGANGTNYSGEFLR